jgi:cytochrome c
MHAWIATLGIVAALGAATPAQADPQAEMTKAGCAACHALDKKLIGPSHKEIAAKYKGQAGAVDSLITKSRAGGKGVWGQIPMPPNPVAKIGDAELKAAVEWILKQ